jgi:hypothetical protein
MRSLYSALDQTLSHQSLAEQLTLAGNVLVQLSEVCSARAERIITDWEQRHHPMEPVIDLEDCVDLFFQSLSLDVAELFEEPEPVQYPTNRKQKSSELEDGSVAGDVDKNALLNWVDQMAAEQPLDETQMTEQIRDLAHGENVEEWSRAIAQHFQAKHTSIRLVELQKLLQRPIVEVWLGLLLGGFRLKQQGDFYDSLTVWVDNKYEMMDRK